MTVTESTTESVFSNNSGLFCKIAVTESGFSKAYEAFPRNDSDQVNGRFCDRICF